jgi:hypothetical protein
METKTVTPALIFTGSRIATRPLMTPSSSIFWMRRQQGVVESPTLRPISATGVVASFCRSARILRSILSKAISCPLKSDCVLRSDLSKTRKNARRGPAFNAKPLRLSTP